MELSSMKAKLIAAISGVSIATTVLIGGFFLYGNYKESQDTLVNYRADLEQNIEREMKGETQIAYSILEEYYKKQQAGELTEEQAKKEAADRVRDLRYNGGQGYFWIDTVNGDNVVLLGSKTEGTNRLNAKDSTGFPFIQEINKNAQQEGGGYTRWTFPKPGETESLPKLGYSICFQPYQWVVGTGVYIDEVDKVIAAREQEINDILKLATGVDVRQRGGFGVQTDISINGGTFDQITILLNGVNMSSPQTGHNAADFPVSLSDIERIEVLEGASARVFGSSAFNGAINIVTRTDKESSVRVSAEGGSFGTFGGDAGLSLRTGSVSQQLSGGYTQSDGGTANSDFKRRRMYYMGSWESRYVNLSWQGGLSSQDYGASTF